MTTGGSPTASRAWIVPFALGGAMFALGAVAGAFLTLSVQTSSMPLVRDNIVAGMAVHDAVRGRPGPLNDREKQQPLSTP